MPAPTARCATVAGKGRPYARPLFFQWLTICAINAKRPTGHTIFPEQRAHEKWRCSTRLGQTGLQAQSPMREYRNPRSNEAQDQPADATRQLFPLLKIALRITLHVPQRDALSPREPVNPVSRKVKAMDGYRSVRCFIVDICAHTARRVVSHGTVKHRIGALHDGFLGIEFEPDFREQ